MNPSDFNELRKKYIPAPAVASSYWTRATHTTEKPTVPDVQTKGFNLREEIRAVLGMGIEDLQKLTMDFINHYKTLTSINEKKEALATHFLNINQWRP